jgi:hypothetical protein
VHRNRLPDIPFAPTRNRELMNALPPEQRALIHSSCLVVDEKELTAWLDKEKAKRRWPSQRGRPLPSPGSRRFKSKRHSGRPTRQTDALRLAVQRLAAERNGRAMSIAALRRLLIERGFDGVPSEGTLRRLVDDLFADRGESRFHRLRPRRRKKAKSARDTGSE